MMANEWIVNRKVTDLTPRELDVRAMINIAEPKEIAEELEISHERVLQIRRQLLDKGAIVQKNGVPKPRSGSMYGYNVEKDQKGLTRREREVRDLIASGVVNLSEIAQLLDLSRERVRQIKAELVKKEAAWESSDGELFLRAVVVDDEEAE